MSRRIFYDGLNLSLEHGTGIATYTRILARIARDLGYEVGAVYSSPHNRPAKNPLLREIAFFDPHNAARSHADEVPTIIVNGSVRLFIGGQSRGRSI